MSWTVFLTRKAYKQLHKLPQNIQDLVDLAIADLESDGLNFAGWDLEPISKLLRLVIRR